MYVRNTRSVAACIGLSIALLAGRAAAQVVNAAPPADCDFRTLAGKWEGTLTTRGGQRFTATLEVREDGTWDNLVEGIRAPGPKFTGRTRSGMAGTCRWQSYTTGNVGSFLLEGSGAERTLIMRPDNGLTEAKLKPAR